MQCRIPVNVKKSGENIVIIPYLSKKKKGPPAADLFLNYYEKRINWIF